MLKDEKKETLSKVGQSKKRHNFLLSALFTVSLLVFLYSSYRIVLHFAEENEQKNLKESIIEEGIQKIPVTDLEVAPNSPGDTSVPVSSMTVATTTVSPRVILKRPDIAVDFQVLVSKYPSLVGWLYAQDEAVHDPVVKWTDNDYYLNHLPNGVTNHAGSLFMDYRDSADLSGWNHIIYGHNMKNGSMFGFLHQYRAPGYFEQNPYLFYFSANGTYRLEIFAGLHTSYDSFIYTHPGTEDEKTQYLADARKRSVFSADVSVSPSDKIVVLSTCSGAIDSPDRFVILAKLVSIF